jgi:hypothetical protein
MPSFTGIACYRQLGIYVESVIEYACRFIGCDFLPTTARYKLRARIALLRVMDILKVIAGLLRLAMTLAND